MTKVKFNIESVLLEQALSERVPEYLFSRKLFSGCIISINILLFASGHNIKHDYDLLISYVECRLLWSLEGFAAVLHAYNN
jgi:hypothetical protein